MIMVDLMENDPLVRTWYDVDDEGNYMQTPNEVSRFVCMICIICIIWTA